MVRYFKRTLEYSLLKSIQDVKEHYKYPSTLTSNG